MIKKKPLKSGSAVSVDKLNKTTGKKEITMEKGNMAEVNDRTLPQSMLPLNKSLVGISKGLTLNLGSYQSARIDCWMLDMCDSDDKAKMDKLAEMSQMLDEQIEYECSEVKHFIETLK